MANKRKKNSGSGIEILLAIPIAIFMFLKEHMWLTFLIAAVIIAVIIGVKVAKHKKREAFLRWYYDRERRIAEINLPKLIDQRLTDAILSASATNTPVTVGRKDKDFDNISEFYRFTTESSDIITLDDGSVADKVSRVSFDNFGIKTACKPMVIRFADNMNDGGYVLYIFPETVLAFVEGPEQVVFLAAYHPSALKIMCNAASHRVEKIVYEKSQNPIRYYDKFNPIRDAEIVSSRWKETNKDGSRSFKGGLLPEHNPLTFTLKYGKVKYQFGSVSATNAYSRFKPAEMLAATYAAYSTGKFDEFVVPESVKPTKTEAEEKKDKARELATVLNKKVENNVFTSTTTTRETKSAPAVVTPSVFTATDTTEKAAKEESAITAEATPIKAPVKATEPPVVVSASVPQKPISVDDARYRNRMVAHPIAQRLNAAYMDSYEFKIYQVRKPRSDWGMQDAGIYTYITVDDVRYTVEFNIRTIPEDGTTQLEFYVWADTLVAVQKAFQAVINREDMQIKATGFSITYEKDYQNLSNEQMTVELEKIIKELFALLVTNSNGNATPSNNQATTLFCTQCGKTITPGHAFCGKCGSPVKK